MTEALSNTPHTTAQDCALAVLNGEMTHRQARECVLGAMDADYGQEWPQAAGDWADDLLNEQSNALLESQRMAEESMA